MTAITRGQMEHVAELARLRFTPQAAQKMVGELDRILQYVNQLSLLDTSGVVPTTHALEPRDNVLRPDDVGPGLSREEALAGAPAASDGMFRVPRVVGAG